MRRLFIGTMCVMALLTKTDPQSAQEYSRLGTVESLVVRGTYQLDDSIFIGTIDKIYRDGHFYSHQPPLLPTLEAPVYWLLSLPGTHFNNRGRFIMTYAFSLLTNGLAFALTVVVFAQILALAGVSPPLRDWLAVLLPFGTWLFPFALVANNHGISGLLVAVLTYLLLLIEWDGVRHTRSLAIGLVLGLLVGIEMLPLVSFVPLTFIYLVVRRDLDAKGWACAAAGFLAPLAVHAIINIQITGDVIPAGFHTELFDYPGSVFNGSSLSGGIKYDTWLGFESYAWTSLFAGKGFFTFAPSRLLGLLVGFAGWGWWSRARGPHLVLLGSVILSLGAALLTTNNYGGEAVGFRHAAYLAPACITLLLPWIVEGVGGKRSKLYAVMGVAAVSCLLMLTYGIRNPWSTLTLTSARIGKWEEYVPLIARSLKGDLFNP